MTMLFHNEDCTNFFMYHSIPGGKAGEVVDAYVDVMAETGITEFLINTNGRRTNYRSVVWESFWDGYDPAGPDNQPFLAAMSSVNVAAYRKVVGNMLACHQQGIDYPARVIQRCRHHGISPWISLRMNDCHYNDIPEHPFHGSFWKENPQYSRQGCTGYFANCLDYARQEVRDYYKALIVETLNRYDINGIELDFMREPYLFSNGAELEGTPILTAWIREIRKLVIDAANKRGHPVQLGIRAPSHPVAALGLGIDAPEWTREGLIDMLVVTPRWATIEFDLPIQQWRNLLENSKVTLAGGLEVLYRPYPDAPATVVSPELATGAAISVLSRGADAVYLFNYFQDGVWPLPVYQSTLKAMTSLDSLLKLISCVGITYRDIVAPNENYRPSLPANGKEITLSLSLGPIKENQQCKLLIGLASAQGCQEASMIDIAINGNPCTIYSYTMKDGLNLLVFDVPFAATSVHEIKIARKEQSNLKIERLEMSIQNLKFS